jgi:protein phosphatase 1A
MVLYRMLVKGVKEGRWTEKFISRINFKGDLIVSSPDVSLVELGPDVEFGLLATDGLWDYIKSSEAVALVRDQLRQHGDVQVACEALGQIALDRRSQDNISIVIADLGRTNWKELPAQRPNLFLELTQAVATVGAVSLGIYISSLLALQ